MNNNTCTDSSSPKQIRSKWNAFFCSCAYMSVKWINHADWLSVTLGLLLTWWCKVTGLYQATNPVSWVQLETQQVQEKWNAVGNRRVNTYTVYCVPLFCCYHQCLTHRLHTGCKITKKCLIFACGKWLPFLINGFAYPLLLQHIGNKASIIMLYTFISKMMACGRIDARHMMKRK